jgi:L-threonylcarbamoyladenylate synthase
MKIVRVTEDSVHEAAAEAARALSAGSVIIFPTDTVYGLGADITNPSALKKLREIKDRHSKKPTSIIVPDIATLEKYGVLNAPARTLAEQFLPGPLTLVLPANSAIPKGFSLDGTIGIRIPLDPFCLELARIFKKPFTATSANREGRETPTNAEHLIKHFGHHLHDVELVVDAGDKVGHLASTIVSCVTETPVILRVGALSAAQLGITT